MIHDKLKGVKCLLLDVDGVLTDGTIVYDDSGKELKFFNVHDGLGIRLLMTSGIIVGIITGRISKALRYRCENLGISLVFDGVKNKAAVLDQVVEKTGVSPENIAFMGDDLPDLALMCKVGVAIAVADASPEVIDTADLVTKAWGGHGAVREISENILKSQQRWKDIINLFK